MVSVQASAARRSRSAAKGTIEQTRAEFAAEFAADVADGLAREQKFIPSRWLYDAEGSRLFDEITSLEEYYPTARELEILSRRAGDLARAAGPGPWVMAELGAGSGLKTEILLAAWRKIEPRLRYRPIDVSASALGELERKLAERLPGLDCRPVEAENFSGLAAVARERGDERLCVVYLGSSIGNRCAREVDEFLSSLRAWLTPGDLALIGFDLVKSSERLLRAYFDSRGVTSEFNLNLLRRMNRELGAHFDDSMFRHEATWNPSSRAMESWLVSLADQEVTIAAIGRSVHFKKWEPIRTETSLKFEPGELSALGVRHGFRPLAQLSDEAGDFADVLWMAAPELMS